MTAATENRLLWTLSLLWAVLTGAQLNTPSQWHARRVWMRYHSVHISPGRRMIMLIPIHAADNAILVHHSGCVCSALLKKYCDVASVSILIPPPLLRASHKQHVYISLYIMQALV